MSSFIPSIPTPPPEASGPEKDLISLREKIRFQYLMADRLSQVSCRSYLENIVIDSRPERKRYGEIAEPWQWKIAEALIPAFENVTRVEPKKGYYGPRCFWITLPRGHDKTSLIARFCNWAIAYSRWSISLIACAKDKEQAGILAETAELEANLNPWLARRIDFKNFLIRSRPQTSGPNVDTKLRILACDASGSYGYKSDIMILDELTWWSDTQGKDMFGAIASGREKRPNSILVVISNAGVIDTWQWNAFQVAKANPEMWKVIETEGPVASWMTVEKTKDLRAMLPPILVKRIYDNEWVNENEDCGFVSRREAEQCEILGRKTGLTRQTRGLEGIQYYAGLDYGPKKDRTVCTVMHMEGDDLIVDEMDVWQGKDFPNRTVPVAKVEEWIEDTKKRYPKIHYVADKYELESTVQKFERNTSIERFEPRGGKSNYELCQILRDLIVNGRLRWYPGCGEIFAQNSMGVFRPHSLVDEFSELIIRPMTYGYRLDHTSGKHDDRAVAIGMAAWKILSTKRLRTLSRHPAYF